MQCPAMTSQNTVSLRIQSEIGCVVLPVNPAESYCLGVLQKDFRRFPTISCPHNVMSALLLSLYVGGCCETTEVCMCISC